MAVFLFVINYNQIGVTGAMMKKSSTKKANIDILDLMTTIVSTKDR